VDIDSRITKQAEIIVNHSIKAKKGERVTIVSEYEGRPLVKEIYKLLLKKGVSDLSWKLIDEDLDIIYYKYSTKAQRQAFSKVSYYDIKNTDCFIRIYAPSNVKSMSEVDPANPAKISERIKTLKPISDWRVNKTRWVVTLFPTNSLAQEAGMSLYDYKDFVFNAINNVSWDSLKEKQAKLKKLVDRTRLVKIVNKDTDLTFSIEGRKAESCYGKFNMPDGEVFTSVVENSVNGFVTFSFPAIYLGREFENGTER